MARVGLEPTRWHETPFLVTRQETVGLVATYTGAGLPGLEALERHDTPELARRALAAWTATPAATRAAAVEKILYYAGWHVCSTARPTAHFA